MGGCKVCHKLAARFDNCVRFCSNRAHPFDTNSVNHLLANNFAHVLRTVCFVGIYFT